LLLIGLFGKNRLISFLLFSTSLILLRWRTRGTLLASVTRKPAAGGGRFAFYCPVAPLNAFGWSLLGCPNPSEANLGGAALDFDPFQAVTALCYGGCASEPQQPLPYAQALPRA
jgi:hypothetical protein